MAISPDRNLWRAFWDWFVLFSGISTASNLSRTRPDPVRRGGIFLFRPGRSQQISPKLSISSPTGSPGQEPTSANPE